MADTYGAIERNGKVQVQIIDDLLDMSRIMSGKIRLEVRPVQLADVIEAAIDTIRPLKPREFVCNRCSTLGWSGAR